MAARPSGEGTTRQRRICLGQPDRADAHGPLPRRGGRRCARQPARVRRASRSPANITSTMPARRCRRSRRSAHLRYREALGEDIGEIPEGFYPGDYLMPVGRRSPPNSATGTPAAPESEWLDLFRTSAVAAMMDMIRADLGAARHPSRRLRVRGRGAGCGQASTPPSPSCARKGLVYDGVLEAPKGETPDDWEPVELPLFRSTAVRRRSGSADPQVGRRARPISAPISPTTAQKARERR